LYAILISGGGSCESTSDIVMERVRDIIKPSVDGLTNNFDSDAIGKMSILFYTDTLFLLYIIVITYIIFNRIK